MTPRLHVMLGAGGVGKTTLAAGYALALAREGRRVGLLGIDPARRLQGALGLTLPDLEVPVPGVDGLSAALLRADDCLRRWAAEACPDDATRDRLLANSFFRALADRFAGATDFLAAVRVAEWLERDPSLTDLVIDTAPGFNAIEFLRRPEHVSAFLEGSLVTWLRWLTKEGGAFGGLVRAGARRVLGAISHLGGTRLLLDMAEFVTLVEGVFNRMAARLEVAQRLLRGPTTSLVIVTAVRHDAAQTVQQLVEALAALKLAPSAVVINRAVAPELGEELARLDLAAPSAVGANRHVPAAKDAQAFDGVSRAAPVPRDTHARPARSTTFDGIERAMAPESPDATGSLGRAAADAGGVDARGPAPSGVLPGEAQAVLTYARAFAALQAQLADAVAAPKRQVLVVPAAEGLDEAARLSALEALGRHLLSLR